jgi:hypothetical protein
VADEAMGQLMTVLLVGGIAVAVVGGLGKMAYQMMRLAKQPPRRRQPWEYDPQ